MIAGIMANKQFQAITIYQVQKIEYISQNWVFISQFYFPVPKEVRLNATHYLIMKIHNKRELKNITFNHSADIDYNDFMKTYTTLPANSSLRFRKNLLIPL